jgi:Ca2+-binding RTX toxin-like protein
MSMSGVRKGLRPRKVLFVSLLLSLVGFNLSTAPAAWATHLCNGAPTTMSSSTGGTVFGTDNNDVIGGSPGNDLIHAQAGNDRVCGRGGNDTINGGFGVDILFGGLGNDSLNLWGGGGVGGPEQAFGGFGNDSINASSSPSTLNGGPGSDRLTGGQSADTLNGDGGPDFIFARDGAAGPVDQIDGGDGLDYCEVEANDSVTGCEFF